MEDLESFPSRRSARSPSWSTNSTGMIPEDFPRMDLNAQDQPNEPEYITGGEVKVDRSIQSRQFKARHIQMMGLGTTQCC